MPTARPLALPIAAAALSLLLAVAPAAAYQIGHRVVTFQDPARGNRSIPTDVYYPADTAGSNVPIAVPPAAGFPVVSFGHGFAMGSNLYSFVEDLAADGFIVVLPATETSLLPSHANFGEDLAFLVNALKSEGANAASAFYGAVGKGAVAGHSMGGGASLLGAQGDPGVDAVFHFAAANTNPSSINAAAAVTVPTLVIAAPNDCVAPPGSHQIPMYEASASSCKTYVAINGASHCQFNDYNLTCDLGEFCNASISRGTQHSLVTAILVPWLDAVLSNAPFRWDDFQTTLASSPASYAVAQSCPDPPEPACSNGLDDDGDGLVDAPADPGCGDAGDDSERSAALACDNGVDDDGDGLADYPADPGCAEPASTLENPKCDDGLDNDSDGGIDWDGGPTSAPIDPQCAGKPWRNKEGTGSCGLGAEILLALALATRMRTRTR